MTAKLFGYNGKLAYIDVNTREVIIKDLDPLVAKNYIGGCGLGAKIIYDLLDAKSYELLKVDPLSDINPLVFATGPMTASMRPSSGRYSVSAISPLTGIWGESTSGGQFPAVLKHSGFDAIVITGKSKTPIYILIQNSKIEIKDASHIWGLNTYDTQDKLKEEIGDKRVRVACIGKAGENVVNYACVINDEGRAAGRTGMGAVMGSKKCKALAIVGNLPIEINDKEKVKEITDDAKKTTNRAFSSSFFEQFGTLCYLDMGQIFGDTPSKYFSGSEFISSHLTGRALKQEFPVVNAYCYGCTIGCGRTTYLERDGKEVKIDGPEYETVAAYGPLLGIDKMGPILEMNHLSNEEGIDTISAGVSIAFLIYLIENNLVNDAITKSLNGINIEQIKWNNPEIAKKLLLKIINQEDIGVLLGKGVREMARELKVDPELAAHVKGLEIPMHDPRAFVGQGLSYMTCCVGANHNKADWFNIDNDAVSFPTLRIKRKDRFEVNKKERNIIQFQDIRAIDDSAINCNFVNLQFPVTLDLFNAITGFNYDKKSLLMCGERINNLKRIINCNLGISRKDDKLPKIVCQALDSGSTRGISLDLEQNLKRYYDIRKWDWETGCPIKEKLTELEIM